MTPVFKPLLVHFVVPTSPGPAAVVRRLHKSSQITDAPLALHLGLMFSICDESQIWPRRVLLS